MIHVENYEEGIQRSDELEVIDGQAHQVDLFMHNTLRRVGFWSADRKTVHELALCQATEYIQTELQNSRSSSRHQIEQSKEAGCASGR